MSTPQDQEDKVEATEDSTVVTDAVQLNDNSADVNGDDNGKDQEEEISKSVETNIAPEGTDDKVEDDNDKTVDNEGGVRDVDTEETKQSEMSTDNIEKDEGEVNADLKEGDTPEEKEFEETSAKVSEQDPNNKDDVSVDPNQSETKEETKSEGNESGPAIESGKVDPEEGMDQALSTDEKEDVTSQSPIPQNDTFTEGDLPESPLPQPVGEKLSREPTPGIDEVSPMQDTSELVPGTPELEGKEVSEIESTQQEEVERSPEPQFDRDVLIEKYNAALAEREQLKQQNYQLQHKLAEYFRKKKSDDRADYDKNVTDQEQRYLKYMDQLQELQKQAKREKENYKLQISDLTEKSIEKKDKVDEEKRKFTQFKIQVATNSLNSRSGKPIPQKDIDMYIQNEEKKEQEVTSVRLENIQSKNKLKKKEQQLKSKEELAEGLHLIDFEQLKIENQTYNEKIEERNEELLKLRKKITSTVQVLTHLKEKLQFVQAENHVQKKKLQDVESLVGQKRDILSRTKQARDSLRIDNHKLRQNCGLLGNEPLLRDFEERKDESDHLKIKLEELRSLHAELALNCNQVRRKIEQARMGQP